MKMKKAAGVNGTSMEAWMYGDEAVNKGLIEIIKKCWKEKRYQKNGVKALGASAKHNRSLSG